jgi:hypothetical protein
VGAHVADREITQAVLSRDELVVLTEKERRAAQIRVLEFLGIRYTFRPDGSLIVHRAHVDAALGVITQPASATAPARKPSQPYWEE